jgi:phycoerythrobilin:ferredoxin oxidoreductase
LTASGFCSTTAQAVDESLAKNTATAKGFPSGSVVRMENRALQPADGGSPIRYARAALLETLVAPAPDAGDSETTDDKIHASGIQVLNLVIFPSEPHLPVFGADFVSLPGNKHLLLLDAQPMIPTTIITSPSTDNNSYSDNFKDWHARYCSGEETNFPWGGAMPEKVMSYVSPNAMWSRLGSSAVAKAVEGDTTPSPVIEDPVTLIQGQLWQAYQEHMDLYLGMLESESQSSKKAEEVDNHRDKYLQYRLDNDPARPMLKALYGEEWTEKVLTEVLFPPL